MRSRVETSEPIRKDRDREALSIWTASGFFERFSLARNRSDRTIDPYGVLRTRPHCCLARAEQASRSALSGCLLGTRSHAPSSVADPLAHCGASSSHYRSHRWTASPVAAQPRRHARVPTASRYSFSKRACSAVPRFHSSQKRSSASSNSASRPVLDAFARATMVGPYRALKCSP